MSDQIYRAKETDPGESAERLRRQEFSGKQIIGTKGALCRSKGHEFGGVYTIV